MDKQLALEADLAQLNAPEREEGMYRPRKNLLARGAGLHKTFVNRERQTLTFRAEAFNLMTHPIFNLTGEPRLQPDLRFHHERR
jgi:hypothetical protein